MVSDQMSLRSGKSDQRSVRLESSDHNLFIVCTMFESDHKRTIVWTIVWVLSDQKLSWSGNFDQSSLCLESQIRVHFDLESLIRGNFSRDSETIAQFGSGLQPGICIRISYCQIRCKD